MLGKALGVQFVLLAAWFVLYPVLCWLGIEQFAWKNLLAGCGLAVALVLLYQVRWAVYLLRLFSRPGGTDAKQGFRSAFKEGARMAFVAMLLLGVVSAPVLVLVRWYMNT